MDFQTVEIRVSKELKEYICYTYSGDLIIPAKDSVLWGLLKQHLEKNKKVPYEHKAGHVIRVAIRNVASAPTFNYNCKGSIRPRHKVICLNTANRASLNRKGEAIIARFLEKCFRQTFIDYMRGASSAEGDIAIKRAIESFCDHNGIDMDETLYQSLKKRWYRYRKEKNFALLMSPDATR